MRLLATLALGLWLPVLAAASADELLAQVAAAIPADELKERGSAVRAQAIAALLAKGGLDQEVVTDLNLALAEAWLEAGDADAAARIAAGIAGGRDAGAGRRERAGLAWVAAWALRARGGVEVEDPEKVVAGFGLPGRRVAARAASAVGERLLGERKPEAVAAFDRALALLANQPPEERVPVYTLRLLAMEAAGEKPEAVQAWLQQRAGDPAAATVAESALTPGQRLVGQPAPRLVAKRLDGKGGEIDLAALRGKPVLIDFFATWCKPCAEVAPAVSALVRRLGERVQVVGVSLDTPDTLGRIPAFIAQHGITWPVVGEGVGWDGEIAPAFHVGAIPALVLIDAQGRVVAVDLVGANAAETTANVERALAGPVPATGAAAAPAAAQELIP